LRAYAPEAVLSVPPEARKLMITERATIIIGAAVESRPREMPPIIVVPAPVTAELARFFVGL
jgi:hypothetical protein